jgi:hypothetical protein
VIRHPAASGPAFLHQLRRSLRPTERTHVRQHGPRVHSSRSSSVLLFGLPRVLPGVPSRSPCPIDRENPKIAQSGPAPSSAHPKLGI